MSRSMDGKRHFCDAPGCDASIEIPVAISPVSTDSIAASEHRRWLFVQRNGHWRHYCPHHCAAALQIADPGSESNLLLRFRNPLLAVDNSDASISAATRVAEFLEGKDGVLLSVLYRACGKCSTPSKLPLNGDADANTAPAELCPGSRTSLRRLMDIFTRHNIPVCLTIRFADTISDAVAAETHAGNYDLVVMPVPPTDSLQPKVQLPVIVLPVIK